MHYRIELGCNVVIAAVFYYVLGNIRPVYRSSIRAIQLFAVARTQDVREYGCKALLQPFLEQMKILGKVCIKDVCFNC